MELFKDLVSKYRHIREVSVKEEDTVQTMMLKADLGKNRSYSINYLCSSCLISLKPSFFSCSNQSLTSQC